MFEETARSNAQNLKENTYPGRGIVIGKSPDNKYYVQIYWIMGRSPNSRNRIFSGENGFVRTRAFDESKVVDPSLIIYYPIKHCGNNHIVSNGDQTDTIYEFIKTGGSFEDALATRLFEPDAPSYTPRIGGIVELKGKYAYKLSILKTQSNNPEYCTRIFYNYEKPVPGYGHCIHTYLHDGNPLPPFAGEPYLLAMHDDIDEAARTYWALLNEENRISLLVKFIDEENGSINIRIINKNR